MALRFAIREIGLYERPVTFTAPFRFGAVTVESAPQAFVRVEIEAAGSKRAEGASAEMMIPKWFDKRPEKSIAQTVDELRRSLRIARGLYLEDAREDTAFGHHASRIEAQTGACRAEDIPALAASFGPAVLDKAILDAVLRASGADVFSGLRANLPGLDNRLTPDLTRDAIEHSLHSARPLETVHVRHTVGMRDPIEGPEGLSAVARQTGCSYFKLKLSGDADDDYRRLSDIGRALAEIPFETKVTLDANEQYGSLAALNSLLREIMRSPALEPIRSRLLYIEQPVSREMTFAQGLKELQPPFPFIIDEADDSYESFPKAAALGYLGVSSKSCKGIYKAILNGARASRWSASSGKKYFLAAEDLTCQAGLAVQQDTALAAFLGIAHAERNGHHYGAGFGIAPAGEAEAFLEAHPGFYRRGPSGIELAIENGVLKTAPLACAGFATAAHPDWDSLAPLKAQP